MILELKYPKSQISLKGKGIINKKHAPIEVKRKKSSSGELNVVLCIELISLNTFFSIELIIFLNGLPMMLSISIKK